MATQDAAVTGPVTAITVRLVVSVKKGIETLLQEKQPSKGRLDCSKIS
jgi:hypothetical protein